MATLFIIDQSLKDMTGHHYDYTRLVAEAASEIGVTPVIGANRLLRGDAARELNQIGQLEKPFRRCTYSHLSYLAGLRELTDRKGSQGKPEERNSGSDPSGFVSGRNSRGTWLGKQLRNRGRKKRMKQRGLLIQHFAEDCERFFSKFSLEDSDQVLFTTLSELELMGLTAFLASHPRTLQVRWNVQFHFSIMTGRPDEFEKQASREKAVLSCFQSALARVPYHDLRGFTTSEELARQYNRMRLLPFQSLPWPINPRLLSHPDIQRVLNAKPENQAQPLRVTIAGGIRREKGQKVRLNKLIDTVWDSHITPGKIRLDVQSGKSHSFTSKSVLSRHRAKFVEERQFREVVHVHPHPLPEAKYAELINRANIGLFCYDSRRYFARRAGILSEFLAAGKPVIVPAGCWLAEQISEPACRHIEEIILRSQSTYSVSATELECERTNVAAAGGIISFNRDRNPFCCSLQRESLDLDRVAGVAIRFRWQWPNEPGGYVLAELKCFDENGQMVCSDKQVIGARGGSSKSLAWCRISKEFSRAEFTFRNAFSDSSISIADVQFQFLDLGDQPSIPRSAVGVVAADEDSLAEAVDEIVTHYDHYSGTASLFSHDWSASHDPVQTVRTLISSEEHEHQTRRRAA